MIFRLCKMIIFICANGICLLVQLVCFYLCKWTILFVQMDDFICANGIMIFVQMVGTNLCKWTIAKISFVQMDISQRN